MSKPQHPYPLPVRRAVAETIAKQVLVMREWSDLTQQTREAFLRDADDVLTALWDASRVETNEQLEQLPDHSFIVDEGGCCISETPDDVNTSYLPAYVIYWGDSDE